MGDWIGAVVIALITGVGGYLGLRYKKRETDGVNTTATSIATGEQNTTLTTSVLQILQKQLDSDRAEYRTRIAEAEAERVRRNQEFDAERKEMRAEFESELKEIESRLEAKYRHQLESLQAQVTDLQERLAKQEDPSA